MAAYWVPDTYCTSGVWIGRRRVVTQGLIQCVPLFLLLSLFIVQFWWNFADRHFPVLGLEQKLWHDQTHKSEGGWIAMIPSYKGRWMGYASHYPLSIYMKMPAEQEMVPSSPAPILIAKQGLFYLQCSALYRESRIQPSSKTFILVAVRSRRFQLAITQQGQKMMV